MRGKVIADQVVSFGTRIRQTTIHSNGAPPNAPALWERRAPLADHRFSTVPHGLPAHLRTVLMGGPEFVIGDGDAQVRRYPMPGSASLASQVLATSTPIPQPWSRVYFDLGRLLARLHGAGQAAPELIPEVEPDAHRRLRTWWQGLTDTEDTNGANGTDDKVTHAQDDPAAPQPPTTSIQAGRDFLSGLSTPAVHVLDGLLNTDLTTSAGIVHGWIGLGVAVFSPAATGEPAITCLLGEDLGSAPPEFDLGTLLAQSVELAVFSPPGIVAAPSACRDDLLAGYQDEGGLCPDPQLLADFTIEHVARHVCDFVQFAHFDPNEMPRWTRLVNWLVQNRSGS
ncbi:MAG: hypothetical protein ACK5MT_19145 [Actinomycetales bacterium]